MEKIKVQKEIVGSLIQVHHCPVCTEEASEGDKHGGSQTREVLSSSRRDKGGWRHGSGDRDGEGGTLGNIQEVKLTSQGGWCRWDVRGRRKPRVTPQWHQDSCWADCIDMAWRKKKALLWKRFDIFGHVEAEMSETSGWDVSWVSQVAILGRSQAWRAGVERNVHWVSSSLAHVPKPNVQDSQRQSGKWLQLRRASETTSASSFSSFI